MGLLTPQGIAGILKHHVMLQSWNQAVKVVLWPSWFVMFSPSMNPPNYEKYMFWPPKNQVIYQKKTSKNVGFGGSWYNPLTSGTSRTCHWLNRVVQSKRKVPRVVETYPPIQKERCLQNAMARFSQNPWDEQSIHLPTNLLYTNSKHIHESVNCW